MQQPKGFIGTQTSHLVCKLHKSLYGLKQAPKAWFDKLYHALLQFGFISSKSDQSLFLRFCPQHTTIILVYVDYILVTGSDQKEIQNLVSQLNRIIALKDLGERLFLRDSS